MAAEHADMPILLEPAHHAVVGNVAPDEAARVAQIDRAFRPTEPGRDPLDAGIGLPAEPPVQHLDARIGIMRAGQGPKRQRHGLMQHPFPPGLLCGTHSIHGGRAEASARRASG